MKIPIVLFLFILTGFCFAHTQFATAVGGTNNDYGFSIIQTSDSGYAVAGYTESFGPSIDLFLVKFSPTGTLEWSRSIGGAEDDWGYSVVQTSDGGYAVAGYTYSFGVNLDLFIVKLSSSGVLEWSRAVGGADCDFGESIVQTSDGGYAVAGYTYSFGEGYSGLFLVKFSSAGDVEWSRTVNDDAFFWGHSIIQTADGGYAVAGDTYNFTSGYSDLLLVKFSSVGDVEWSRIVGGMHDDGGWSLVQTSDGGYAVAGATGNFGFGWYDLFILKFDSVGAIEWSKAVGDTNIDIGYSVIQTSDGGYAVAGLTESCGAGRSDLFIVKFTSVGVLEWSRTAGGPDYDKGFSVVQTVEGGYAVAGETYSFEVDSLDLFLVKFDAEGNNCIGEEAFATVTASSPDVTSPSLSVTIPSPTVTTVTPIVTDVTPTVTEICTDDIVETMIFPHNLELCVYPNPFNSSCYISTPMNAVIDIFDISGKNIAEFSGGDQHWQPENSVGSGVYFVRANVGDKWSETKKVIYLK